MQYLAHHSKGTALKAQPLNSNVMPMKQTIRPLSPEEAARLEAQRKWVREHYETNPDASYGSVAGKLAVVNTILVSGWIEPNETVKLQSLGVAFGDALAQELELIWVTIQDEYGIDPALICEGTNVKVFPITSISKRIERGDVVDVYRLFGEACKAVVHAKNHHSSETG